MLNVVAKLEVLVTPANVTLGILIILDLTASVAAAFGLGTSPPKTKASPFPPETVLSWARTLSDATVAVCPKS